ncbi:unnamed protein product [Durusdinium trenchii]|uniref:Uncharacterized protein n=1 Tax=Durusdinium trenchii TaxID=1381693 RepID=A0ABP0LD82_9DINO
MPQEILLRPHEEAYIKEHKDELKRFNGMDLVFEARMRFLEMPPEQREKLAPKWLDEDQPLWEQGSIPLTALIDEQAEVPVLQPIMDYSKPAVLEAAAQPADEPAPEPVSSAPTKEVEEVAPARQEPEFVVNVLVDPDEQPDVRNILERQLLE